MKKLENMTAEECDEEIAKLRKQRARMKRKERRDREKKELEVRTELALEILKWLEETEYPHQNGDTWYSIVREAMCAREEPALAENNEGAQ